MIAREGLRMTPRFRARMRCGALVLVAIAGFTAFLPGCDPRQAMYFPPTV